jgi:hypothetical protein
MQLSHILVAGTLLAALSALPRNDSNTSASQHSAVDNPPSVQTSPVTTPTAQPLPAANGHYVLVVEGDRNGLAVTFASKKAQRWAGVAKGFQSNWRVSILDAAGAELAMVPLDVRPFATDAKSVGKPLRVQGCIVVDSKIGMLVNVPAFATAARYVFSRTDANGNKTTLGTTASATVRDMSGENR